MSDCKLLKLLVPREGLEPSRDYSQRILGTLQSVSRSLTKRYEPVFTRLAVVKVSLRLATYQHVRPPSWPHLLRLSREAPGEIWPSITWRLSLLIATDRTFTNLRSFGKTGERSVPNFPGRMFIDFRFERRRHARNSLE